MDEREGSIYHKEMIFRSMVYDTAFSGLEAVVLNKGEYEVIERCVMRKARALLKASGWGTRRVGGRGSEDIEHNS